MRLPPLRCLALVSLLIVVLAVGSNQGQQPPPVAPPPQAPSLTPTSLGLTRGGTATLNLAGANLADPVAVWTSVPTKAIIPFVEPNGRAPTSLRLQLLTTADTPVGPHWLRVATEKGISNFRLFCVDDLPEVAENGKNQSRETAQTITVPCVVVGQANREQNDYYRFTAQAGQRLSFEVLGRRLGSLFDPQLTLLDARTGKELPGGHSNDAPGCQTDPRLSYTFKDAGDYLIEVRDVVWGGNPDFSYRLRVGDFPCATATIPMAIKRGASAKLGFAGTAVEGLSPLDVTAPTDPAVQTMLVAPRGKSGLHGWPVMVRVSDLTEVLEQEPNDEATKATKLTLPCGVTGQFLQKGDVDHYTFAGVKGQRLSIEARTHELGSPTEVYMALRDAKGTQLAVSNPETGAGIDYTPPADGPLTLAVEQLHYWSGPAESYHLTLAPYEPSFNLTVGLDRWVVAQGGTVNVPILCARRDYAGPIEVSVIGPASLSGTATIEQGKPTPPTGVAATLPIKCAANAPVGPAVFHIVGKATINNKPVVLHATFRAIVNQGLNNLPTPPPGLDTQFAVAVTSGAEYTLTVAPTPLALKPGAKVKVTVTATRKSYQGPIALELRYLPGEVTAPSMAIAKGQTKAEIELTVGAKAMVGGKGTVQIVGTATELGGQRQLLSVPFTIAP